jgi:uncharacterized membrane protein
MDSNNLIELQFDNTAQVLLRDSARWAKLLSICGFILCGLFILIGIFSSFVFSNVATNPYDRTNMAGIMRGFIAAIYVAMAVLYFFPFLFLYRFSNRMQSALRSNDQQTLINSLGNLRAYFRFVGILVIIGLAFCALAFIFGGLAAALAGR